MKTNPDWLGVTELDEVSHQEYRESTGIGSGIKTEPVPRSYPGYPIHLLPFLKNRWFCPMDAVLDKRRSSRHLYADLPDERILSHLLRKSHGVLYSNARGATPSVGGYQSLELYLAVWEEDWLPEGVFHYNRASHQLAHVVTSAKRQSWKELAPSLGDIRGGGLLWIIVGDTTRISHRFGPRGERLLLLEAGHLMQNLCLMSQSLGVTTVPLTQFFEAKISKELQLPRTDRVLYLGVCGYPEDTTKRKPRKGKPVA